MYDYLPVASAWNFVLALIAADAPLPEDFFFLIFCSYISLSPWDSSSSSVTGLCRDRN